MRVALRLEIFADDVEVNAEVLLLSDRQRVIVTHFSDQLTRLVLLLRVKLHFKGVSGGGCGRGGGTCLNLGGCRSNRLFLLDLLGGGLFFGDHIKAFALVEAALAGSVRGLLGVEFQVGGGRLGRKADLVRHVDSCGGGLVVGTRGRAVIGLLLVSHFNLIQRIDE